MLRKRKSLDLFFKEPNSFQRRPHLIGVQGCQPRTHVLYRSEYAGLIAYLIDLFEFIFLVDTVPVDPQVPPP